MVLTAAAAGRPDWGINIEGVSVLVRGEPRDHAVYIRLHGLFADSVARDIREACRSVSVICTALPPNEIGPASLIKDVTMRVRADRPNAERLARAVPVSEHDPIDDTLATSVHGIRSIVLSVEAARAEHDRRHVLQFPRSGVDQALEELGYPSGYGARNRERAESIAAVKAEIELLKQDTDEGPITLDTVRFGVSKDTHPLLCATLVFRPTAGNDPRFLRLLEALRSHGYEQAASLVRDDNVVVDTSPAGLVRVTLVSTVEVGDAVFLEKGEVLDSKAVLQQRLALLAQTSRAFPGIEAFSGSGL